MSTALITYRSCPGVIHWAIAWSAFPSDDYPVDTPQVERAEVFKQGLDRQEPHDSRNGPQGFDAREAVAAIFNAHSKPDIRVALAPICWEPFDDVLVSLCENLKNQ